MTQSITPGMGSGIGASVPKRAVLWLAGVALASLVGGLLFAGAARTVDDDARRRFDNSARDTQERLGTAIKLYTGVLRGLAGLFEANEQVSRLQFHRFVQTLDVPHEFPAIEAVSWAPEVADAGRDAFIAAVRADRSLDPAGYPEFTIKPPGRRASYTVLTYLEPMVTTRGKLGVDMQVASPQVAQALADSRDSGGVSASGRPVQVARPVPHIALGMRLPVYRGGAVPASVAERRAAYLGSVGIGFSVPALVGRAIAAVGAQPVTVELYAETEPQPGRERMRIVPADRLLYGDAGARGRGPRDGWFETVLPVDFNGSLWKARFSAPKAELNYGFDRYFPWLAMACGFGATLLIYQLFLSLYWSRRGALE
jgi:two-component system, sensor histidine kinase and response regulator